ncbi:MAG: polysulfide reductase NrfD, partial [Actinomycetota bacterium]|nr:polysulfide reductase NrfD [Actinomycetota bacterium]
MTAHAETGTSGSSAGAHPGDGPAAGVVTREGQQHRRESEQARMWEGGHRKGGDHGGRKRRRRPDPHSMVPEAEFTSYYGRPIIKAPVWTWDIAAYLFLGGVAGGSSLLAAGADATGATSLRRQARATALAAIGASTYFLIHDLGRPSRFHHMLRVVRPTSPMSMGTWILSAYGPAAGLAAMSELAPLLPRRGVLGLARRVAPAAGSVAGGVAALTAPALTTYTAVLLADTSVPTWHASRHELPFVFAGSAAAAASGAALIANPVAAAGPARRLAVLGSVLELAADTVMERRLGLLAEPLHAG